MLRKSMVRATPSLGFRHEIAVLYELLTILLQKPLNRSCARLMRTDVDVAQAFSHVRIIISSRTRGEPSVLAYQRSLATRLKLAINAFVMPNAPDHVDKPEPRAQAVLAFLAICTIYLALPRNLVVGPIWLLPTVILLLLVPTVVSHRVGKRSLNRILGFIINGITTSALIGSVVLLVRLLPSHREPPLQLLRSGGLL